MTTERMVFDNAIPEYYDRFLGPFCFRPYGEVVLSRLTGVEAGSLLELAAGTGVVTEVLRGGLHSAWEITASDLNESMLNVARAKPSLTSGVEFQIADACALPFPDASFDVVVCQFGWMFFSDKELAAREALRVLKPGGRLLFDVWDRLESCGAFYEAHKVATHFFPSEPPGFLNVPFGFHDRAVLSGLLTAAGFRDVSVSTSPRIGIASRAHDVAKGLFQGTPLSVAIADRDASKMPAMIAALTERLEDEFGDEPMRSPLQAVFCSGVRPNL